MTGRLAIRKEHLRKANPRLWIDKFMDRDEPDWPAVAASRLDDGVYRLAYQRWERHWSPDSTGALCLKGRVSGRLIVGLGNESVHEVGIRLSHSYGTPIVPGSAIKGTLRSRIEDVGLRDFLFGSQDSAGFAEFQDAWWIPENRPPLVLDVVTVHHPDYYAERAVSLARSPQTAGPTDFDNPTPVPFLSVQGSFFFVARFLGEDAKGAWKIYVRKLLEDTLEKDGIGGKRSAGYGRFVFGAK